MRHTQKTTWLNAVVLVAPTLLVNEATCLKMPECLKADIWQTLQLPASSTRVQKITEAIALFICKDMRPCSLKQRPILQQIWIISVHTTPGW